MRPIKEGDKVIVTYNNERDIWATVLHAPQDVGDLWYFKTDAGLTFGQNPVSSNFDAIISLEGEDE